MTSLWWSSLLCGQAFGLDPVIEPLEGGWVNWTTMEIVASATGHPQSGAMLNYETLEADARAQLGPRMLTLVREVRVDADQTVADLLERHDALADRLAGNFSLWDVFETRYYTSGKVEIDGSLALQEVFRPVLVAGAKGRDRGSPPTGPITGLVVDARGLEVKPAMAPRLLAADGAVLYGVASLTEAAASTRGPAAYVGDPADAIAVRRAGSQPLFVHATAVVQESDLVLTDADAAQVRARAAESPFLVQGSVVLVVRP